MTDWPLPVADGAGVWAPQGVDPARASDFVLRLISAAEGPGDGEAEARQLLETKLPPMSAAYRVLFLRALLWDALEAGCFRAVRALLQAGGRIWGPAPWGGEPVFVLNTRVHPGWFLAVDQGGPDAGRRFYNSRPVGSWGVWNSMCWKRGLGRELPSLEAWKLSVSAILAAGAPTARLFGQVAWDVRNALGMLGQVLQHPVGVACMRYCLWWFELLHASEPVQAVSGLRALEQDLRETAVVPHAGPAHHVLMAKVADLLCTLTAWGPARRSWVAAVVRAAGAR